MVLLVERETAGVGAFWVEDFGLLLEFDRLIELVRFGVGGSERLNAGGAFPVGQLAGLGGVFDRFAAVAIFGCGTDREKVSGDIVGTGILSIERDGLS